MQGRRRPVRQLALVRLTLRNKFLSFRFETRLLNAVTEEARERERESERERERERERSAGNRQGEESDEREGQKDDRRRGMPREIYYVEGERERNARALSGLGILCGVARCARKLPSLFFGLQC